MHRPVSIAFVAAALLAGGCGSGENNAPKAEPAKTEAAAVDKAETPDKPETAEKTEPTKKVEPLTKEELELIDADPATLTPDLRRQRAFALRKRIMQNPDSPAAQALEDMRKKVESGEVTPQLPGKELHSEASVPSGHPPSSIPDDSETPAR